MFYQVKLNENEMLNSLNKEGFIFNVYFISSNYCFLFLVIVLVNYNNPGCAQCFKIRFKVKCL